MSIKRPQSFGMILLPQLLLVVIVACITPQGISAGGGRENNQLYESEMKATVDHLTVAVESGDISAAEARTQLAELRNRFRKDFDEEHGVIEAFLDAIEAGDMSSTEAIERYYLLRQDIELRRRKESDERKNKSPDNNLSDNEDEDDEPEDDEPEDDEPEDDEPEDDEPEDDEDDDDDDDEPEDDD